MTAFRKPRVSAAQNLYCLSVIRHGNVGKETRPLGKSQKIPSPSRGCSGSGHTVYVPSDSSLHSSHEEPQRLFPRCVSTVWTRISALPGGTCERGRLSWCTQTESIFSPRWLEKHSPPPPPPDDWSRSHN